MASGLTLCTDSQFQFFVDHLKVSSKLSTCNHQATNEKWGGGLYIRCRGRNEKYFKRIGGND